MSINNIKPYSLTPDADFMWAVEDGMRNWLLEFNGRDKWGRVRELDREEIKTVALLGLGNKIYYSSSDGIIRIDNGEECGKIQLKYREGNKLFSFNSPEGDYRDYIIYKRCFATPNNGRRAAESGISHHCVGYKAKLEMDGIEFNLKIVIEVPEKRDEKATMNIRLVSSRDMNGELIVIRDGLEESWEAPLKRDRGGEITIDL